MFNLRITPEGLVAIAQAFPKGPFQVITLTNAHAIVVNSENKTIITCSTSTDAPQRAQVLCVLLNQILHSQ